MTDTELCEICRKVASKYTCPLCKFRYCKIVCFKQHKEGDNTSICMIESKRLKALDEQPIDPSTVVGAQSESSTTTNKVPVEILENSALERLAHSRTIRQDLSIASNRDTVNRILQAPAHERRALLELALHDDVRFSSFANDILSVVGLRELKLDN